MDAVALLSICLPLLLIFILRKLLNIRRHRNLPIPPGPTPWPILGNILQLAGSMPHVKFAELSNTFGPLISVRLGMQLVVVGSSPAVAEEILKENDRVLSARFVPAAMPFEIHNLRRFSIGFSPECGEGWKAHRAMCRTELFGGKAIESSAWVREKKAIEMADGIRSKEGMAVDVGMEVFDTVLNSISNTLMSMDLIKPRDASQEDDSMRSLAREYIEIQGEPNISDLYPMLRRMDIQGLRKKAKRLTHKMIDAWRMIIEKRGNGEEGMKETRTRDFLDALIAHNYTKEAIYQIFWELFTAGTDTITVTVEWAMAELVRNPKSMKRLREELDRYIGPCTTEENQLPGLPYLQACVNETLRLHPPATLLLPRRAPEPCKVMDYAIPKDAQILINVWAIGRDPKVWEDPLSFKPERFLDSSLDFKGNHFEFMPFGGGRRICPGLPMAAKQVPLLLATLVNLFDWRVPEGGNLEELDMTEQWGITVKKAQPLLLIPSVRK
ncbi:hypothetical protein MLD38_039116 [Melastoma candidum]|uniref:Uncharacterized protein n=1 Tax=Melastoma candidum TaxID=119954 RepID=A0ACB9L1S9_9MYRT|nr:hypothetical protein MLD38_039116 [Melastoma candidum]